MNRHYGIKPHSCPHCERTFASKSDMKQHERQHTGERPFSCPICSRTFVHRSNCYAHARKAHNKELANNPELARAVKISETEVIEEDGTTIMVVTDGTEKETITVDPPQETVQIAELLLSQHDKGASLQQAMGQTYTTIQTPDGSGGTLNTVIVPQYMYSTTQAANIYTSTVTAPGDFTASQQQPQQQQAQQATELKFCLYEG